MLIAVKRLLLVLIGPIRIGIGAIARRIAFHKDGIHVSRGSYVHSAVKIGRYTRINAASHIGPCVIGSYCAIGGRLIVRSSNHTTEFLNMQSWAQKHVIQSALKVAGYAEHPVVIGNGVWIGDSVIVLPGVRIGDGSVIGAGSVVTKSIPDYAVAAGVPARVIRYRFSPQVIEVLRRIEWWAWPVDTIRGNRWLFETNLAELGAEDFLALLEAHGLGTRLSESS